MLDQHNALETVFHFNEDQCHLYKPSYINERGTFFQEFACRQHLKIAGEYHLQDDIREASNLEISSEISKSLFFYKHIFFFNFALESPEACATVQWVGEDWRACQTSGVEQLR